MLLLWNVDRVVVVVVGGGGGAAAVVVVVDVDVDVGVGVGVNTLALFEKLPISRNLCWRIFWQAETKMKFIDHISNVNTSIIITNEKFDLNQ